MRSAMSRLFREENDVRELIRLKAVCELRESTSDRCDDVANLIGGRRRELRNGWPPDSLHLPDGGCMSPVQAGFWVGAPIGAIFWNPVTWWYGIP
jgi:hypothetical protein